ncbi:MAG: universal stress protein UspA [Erythrobacter sp.]|nr:universal stress protein UspA [Erythrobacter sp.]
MCGSRLLGRQEKGADVTKPFEVLLASDFTARSDRPLDRAARIAAERKGELVIAHVLEGTRKNPVDETAIIEALKADLPEQVAGAELVIRSGSAPKTLASIASERGSDLIATGVARYNSIGDFVLGTAVDHIIRNATAPVLIVRRRPKHNYRRLLVATDCSDCSRTALLAAARLFPHIPITVTHAFHVPYQAWLKSDDVKQYVRAEAQEGLNAFLAHQEITPDIAVRVEAMIDEGETGSVVARQLTRTGADLLVLGTHGHGGFVHATIGSQAEALLESVDVDVLMVRGS